MECFIEWIVEVDSSESYSQQDRTVDACAVHVEWVEAAEAEINKKEVA